MADLEKGRKKELVLSICAVMILMVAVVGISYAVFTFSKNGTVENTITTGTITFTYTSDTNGITLQNAQPITDATGKVLQATDAGNGVVQGYFDFTVAAAMNGNIPINYEISSTYDSTVSNLLDPQYVKVYLTDGGSTEVPITGFDSTVPTYSQLPTATIATDSKKLYSGVFTESSSKKFRLRIWVAENYATNDVAKTFKMKVNVNAAG